MLLVKTRRILLIEDEKAMQEVTQTCLETAAGWEVLTAEFSREALERAAAAEVDAILVDVDGLVSHRELFSNWQQLRHSLDTKQIPIVLLIATLPSHELLYLAEWGISAAIVKPFDLMALPSQVAAVLHW